MSGYYDKYRKYKKLYLELKKLKHLLDEDGKDIKTEDVLSEVESGGMNDSVTIETDKGKIIIPRSLESYDDEIKNLSQQLNEKLKLLEERRKVLHKQINDLTNESINKGTKIKNETQKNIAIYTNLCTQKITNATDLRERLNLLYQIGEDTFFKHDLLNIFTRVRTGETKVVTDKEMYDQFKKICNLKNEFIKDLQNNANFLISKIDKETEDEAKKMYSGDKEKEDLKNDINELLKKEKTLPKELQNEKKLVEQFIKDFKNVPVPHGRSLDIRPYITYAKDHNLFDENINDIINAYNQYNIKKRINENEQKDLIKRVKKAIDINNYGLSKGDEKGENKQICIKPCKKEERWTGDVYVCDTKRYTSGLLSYDYDYCDPKDVVTQELVDMYGKTQLGGTPPPQAGAV